MIVDFPGRLPRFLSSFAAALTATAAGAAVLLAAVPVAVSDLLETPGDSMLRRLQNEEVLNETDLERLIRSREAAVLWRPTARRHTDIALGRMILGEYQTMGPADRSLMEVETELTKGLGSAPMNPYGWMRLVQARSALGAASSEKVSPLRLALRSGPHEDRRHSMLLLLVETGLETWSELQESERALIVEKARHSWNRDVRGTARAAIRADRADLLASMLGF